MIISFSRNIFFELIEWHRHLQEECSQKSCLFIIHLKPNAERGVSIHLVSSCPILCMFYFTKLIEFKGHFQIPQLGKLVLISINGCCSPVNLWLQMTTIEHCSFL